MPRASIERVLPRARLRDLDGVERDLQRGRGPQVVVRCGAAPDRLRYVQSLASRIAELRDWGSSLFAVVMDARL
ncbi:MAG TPA: hypothetical protein VF039_00875, partial [Longimicrobiales bacterium]